MNLWLGGGGGGDRFEFCQGRLVAFFAAVPGGSNKMYINLYILDNYIHLQNLSTIVQSSDNANKIINIG